VNWADLMAAQGAFGTDFYDESILRPKHRAYYRSGRPDIKIGPKGALGSHEIRPIHSAPSLGQSIVFQCMYHQPILAISDVGRVPSGLCPPMGRKSHRYRLILRQNITFG